MPMGLSEASNILWRQRHLLELLLFKLDVEQTLLAAGRLRWLARATNEVEMVLDEIRATELARAVAIDELASTYRLAPGCSLRELAAAVPAPWDSILTEHRTAFLGLTDEIAVVARANRDLVSHGQKAVAEVLDLVGDHGLHDPFETVRPGAGNPRRTSAVLVDEVV
jgi:hypothetical protein